MARIVPGTKTSAISLSTAIGEGKLQVSVQNGSKQAAHGPETRPDAHLPVKPSAKPQPKSSHAGARPFRGSSRGS